MHRQVVLGLPGPQLRVHRVGAGADGDVGAEHDAVAHIDVGVVHQRQVEVGVDVFAEMHVLPRPVGVQRRLDVAALADLGKHLFQQLLALFLLGGAGGVEIILQLQHLLLGVHQLRFGKVDLAAVLPGQTFLKIHVRHPPNCQDPTCAVIAPRSVTPDDTTHAAPVQRERRTAAGFGVSSLFLRLPIRHPSPRPQCKPSDVPQIFYLDALNL